MRKRVMNGLVTAVVDVWKRELDELSTRSFANRLATSQPASPTTLGKEMAIFAYRLSRERKELSQFEILGKFGGAIGNYNAHLVAYPDVNWPQIVEEFVTSLGISFNPYVTQGKDIAFPIQG